MAFTSVQPVVVYKLNEVFVPQVLECLLKLCNDVMVARVSLAEFGFQTVDIGGDERLADRPSLTDGLAQFFNPCAAPSRYHSDAGYIEGQRLSMA